MREEIKIDKALLKKLGLENYRHFAISLGEWAKNVDRCINMPGATYGRWWQGLLKAYLKDKGVL